ncbi:MAG: NAD(P)H-dependent oxidoreductase subunit E [Thermoanaerobacterales bacterium]|nr:NAD(P)H-dependent oxidoreductase subunit E [Thermoanaerobacterales bacterium]
MKIKPAKIYEWHILYTVSAAAGWKYHTCCSTLPVMSTDLNGSYTICEELNINLMKQALIGFLHWIVWLFSCCSLAPVMMINEQAYGPLTPDKALKIIRDLAASEQQVCEGGKKE